MEQRIESTGSSYTTTFDICAYFCVKNGKVVPCPVHMEIVKGYAPGREIYQLVPEHNYAWVRVAGSANPSTGPTPEDYMEEGAVKNTNILASAEYAELFLRSAKDGTIKRVFEDMVSSVPGRHTYYPPGAEEIPVINMRLSIWSLFSEIERLGYPSLTPGWFRGGEIKTGWITPTKQGNFLATSRIKAPVFVGMRPEVEYEKKLSIQGNESNTHEVAFSKDVEVMYIGERGALVYSMDYTEFEISHPQHKTVKGMFKGLVFFIHLRIRER